MLPKNAEAGDPIVTCSHCGYYWGYGGTMYRATCPSCGGKVVVSKNHTGIVLSPEEGTVAEVPTGNTDLWRTVSIAIRNGGGEEIADLYSSVTWTHSRIRE
ncbi:hypothetical protein NP511_18015 [Natrinema thermotolerans]|uniref:Uncharacterized protein n=1 Tax=Natrinema thermotolerans TaxID=121872 RepID=A0AAF0PA13_9EURY|nr:hypothetical protein [Natrinema thermotolerans]WMT07272.1 hypothetical protein NP511_18015 [Natrinema thermotolerans]